MTNFRLIVILTAVAMTTTMVLIDLSAAEPKKKAPASKKAAPKVQPHHNSGPKPNRVTNPSSHHPDHVAKKPKEPTKVAKAPEKGKEPPKVTKSEEKGKAPPKLVKPEEKAKEAARIARAAALHRFARFNERTGEWAFDSRWWYSFVVYPNTVGRYESAAVDYDSLTVPADVSVAPPVIKASQGLPISPAGSSLAARLDALDVENHWLSGQQVSWKTGNPLNNDKGPASNGGAFVAAVGARLKVPMPEPEPESFFPIRQHDWLLDEGTASGWVRVGDVEAQLLANQGWLVVAAWKSTAAGDRSLAGQTAIVRPSGKPAGDVAKRGPQLILASTKNSNDIPLKDSFPAKSWNEVIYIACRPR
jgi:hypothetical protein